MSTPIRLVDRPIPTLPAEQRATDPRSALLLAADLIAARGHAHGYYATPSGELCMEGALRVAVIGRVGTVIGDSAEVYYTAVDHLAEHLVRRGHSADVIAFNDTSDAKTVIQTLRAAANRLPAPEPVTSEPATPEPSA